MTRNVNEHRLPDELVTLVDAGEWSVDHRRLSRLLDLRGASPFASRPLCLPPAQMTSQLDFFRQLGRLGAVWDAYGFTSSSRNGTQPELPWLDVDQAVPVIISDEEGQEVWLDYRSGPRQPRIVAPTPNHSPQGKRGRDYVLVADAFGAFWDMLNTP